MSCPTTVLPDNAFLLWLQDESNNEYLSPESLTQMYTHLAPLADDPLGTFKDDDRNHSFLVFMKHRDTNISRSYLMHHMSMLPPWVGQPTQHEGRYFLSSGDSIHNQFVTHELNANFLEEVNAQYSFTTDRIQREISHAPDKVQIIVGTEDDANLEDLEVLTTCRSMWIPNQYAALVLSPFGIVFTRNYSRMGTRCRANHYLPSFKPTSSEITSITMPSLMNPLTWSSLLSMLLSCVTVPPYSVMLLLLQLCLLPHLLNSGTGPGNAKPCIASPSHSLHCYQHGKTLAYWTGYSPKVHTLL